MAFALVAFSLLSIAKGFSPTWTMSLGVDLRGQNSTRKFSCSTPCEGVIGQLCGLGAAEPRLVAPTGIVPEALEATLRAIAAERGDEHCRAFAEWKYRPFPSDCSAPVGNRTSNRTSIVLVPRAHASAKLKLANDAIDNVVEEVATTALPLELATSPMLQRFATSTLMRREGNSPLASMQTLKPKVGVRREQKQSDAAIPKSSVRREQVVAEEPKLLLRREATDASFKQHLDFFMNIVRSAALILFLVSGLRSLGGGVFKLFSPDEGVVAEVASGSVHLNRNDSSNRVQEQRGEAENVSE